MKKTYMAVLAVAAAGLAASGAAFAYGDGTGIVGSPHDFTDGVVLGVAGSDEIGDWNWRGEICRTCHAPHDKGRSAYQEGILWNRQLSAAVYDTYVMKDGTTPGQPVGGAKMCLSCHDNTVALQEFDSYSEDDTPSDRTDPGTGMTFMQLYDDSHFIVGMVDPRGTAEMSLAGTHPLSVVYDETKVGFNPVTTTEVGTTGLFIADILSGGMVQCSSCHDVHNKDSVAATRLLRVAQTTAQGGTASGLCLTCHDK